MFTMNMRAAGLIAACGLLTLTGACTSEDDPGTGERPAPAASAQGQAAGSSDFALPVDSYAYTNQQNSEIVLAQSILTGTCMRTFGFAYDLAADQKSAQKSQQAQVTNFGLYGNKRRYGVADEATARRYGYHLPSTVDGTARVKPSKGGAAHGLPPMTPAMMTVLTGERPGGGRVADVNGQDVPKGGCRGEAGRTLEKLGTVGQIPLIGRIRADSFTRSVTDPDVVAAFKSWSTCMAGKGYRYDSPRTAGAELDTTSPAVSPREIAIATADVACKKSSDVVRVWSAYEIQYQNKKIDEHAQELRDIAKQKDALLERVGEIIAAGGK